MMKYSLLVIALAVAFAATAQSASANWLSFQRVQGLQAQAAAADVEAPAPVKQVSHTRTMHSVIVHTDACACSQCCLRHIKTDYPAAGYENVFDRGYARTTMGYMVLFGF